MKTHRLAATLLLIAALDPAHAQQRRAMTFEDFAAVRAVSDPQISPDGQRVLYTVRSADVEANRRSARSFVVPATGGAAAPFPAADVAATEGRWSPDGRRVAYISGGQLWIADSDGSNRRQLTTLTGGATGPKWSPTGTLIAFTSSVYPDCRTEECNAERAKAAEASPVKAIVADQLLYRHWMTYDRGTRSHLFVIAPDGSGLRDLTPGVRYDVPPGPFGGSEGYAFSPDGREIAYTAKDEGREAAWTTDLNVYTVPTLGGEPTVITAANRGADQNPVYTPDGRSIAYASQERAGFESDRWRLMLYDRTARTHRELLPGWDRNAYAYQFLPDMSAVLVHTGNEGRNILQLFRLGGSGVDPRAAAIVRGRNAAAFSFASDGRTVAYLADAADHPAEVYVGTLRWTADRSEFETVSITSENDSLMTQIARNPAEEFWYTAADGARIHGFLVKPPSWQQGRSYPAILLIHGGPQGAWLDQWHSRWNYQMFAAPGYALIIVNPRGSTGFGQEFVDQVSRGWGGLVYTDLLTALDSSLAANPWIDRNSLGAAGGSFGGYMVNWIAGQTDRFRALMSHAGVFNLESMAGATEELWFTEWEFGGMWWDSTAMATQYRRYSPHLFARNFRTPTLVIHGELDYRVPYTEGLQMFTALQRRNVPSRLVLFPDEGHWIAKPQNQRLWWGEVHGWFNRWLRGTGAD
jgi:dipeptidyl aminopeptidase/acylaminoacyl peptidase